MRSRRSARINGLSFVEWPSDHHGSWFVLDQDGIKGVWEGVDVRREDTARPLSHGSFDAPVFLASRVIPVSGHISAPSGAELVHEMNRLTGLLATGGTGRLSLEDDSGVTYLDVRLGAATQITQLDATTARFLVTFWAPDPRRYGETHSYSSGASVRHYGTFPSPVSVTIPSAPSAYTITSPAGVFSVSGATASGTHVVDLRTGRVTRNGSLMLGVSSGPTWEMPPGASWVHTVSTGTGTIKVRDTFV